MPVEKLWRGLEDQRKPRTSELFDSETLKQFNVDNKAINKESPLTIEKYVLISFWFKGGRRPGLLWRYNLLICSSVWRNQSLKQLKWWSICIFVRMKLFYSDAEVPRNKLCNAIILWCLTNAVSLKSDVDIKINCSE